VGVKVLGYVFTQIPHSVTFIFFAAISSHPRHARDAQPGCVVEGPISPLLNFQTLGQRTATDLDPAVWRNPSGFFGACTSWSRKTATCGLDPSAPDQVYRTYANLRPMPTATATPTLTPQPTATPSEPPCEVIGSQPACNSTVSTQVTDFTVYVSYFINGSVRASDFTVNGTPANNASVLPSSIIFHFNASPVVQGENSMHIPRNAFTCINGRGVDEFMCTFTYQPSTPTPTATPFPPSPTPTPRHGPTPRLRPTPPPRP
jgi:hypothetical protein